MKFPSVNFLLEQGSRAFLRFPLTIISAGIAVIIGIYLVDIEGETPNFFSLINMLLCGYLGVPLFVALRTYYDASSQEQKNLWIGRGAIIILLLLIYWYLPGSEDSLNKSISYIRYTIFAVAAHLLVSFAPFITHRSINGFWNFNKSLFLRFLLAVLYSGFFYVGIALALLAIDNLFDVDIDEKLYFQIFIFIAGVFNTWFFVAGIPKNIRELDDDREYPKGLRTFILYVLLPLLALYFLILYAYSAKIIFLWDWPRGIITYMIISVAVLGILTMLLGYPYSQSETKSPIHFLSKGYYWVLLPMIIILFLAIGIRVNDYGITINRYLTILLAVWLTFVSIYMVLFGKNIKLIPISLFCIILLTCWGPWGIFEVSENSQVNRLEAILRSNNLLEDKIKNEPIWTPSDTSVLILENEYQNEGVLSDSLHNEVMSILNYLDEYHGFNEIDHWFVQSPKAVADSLDTWETSVYMRFLGLRYVYKNERDLSYNRFYVKQGKEDNLKKVKGYDYILGINYYKGGITNKQYKDFDELPGFEVIPTDTALIIRQDSVAYLNMRSFYEELKTMEKAAYADVDQSKMTMSVETEWLKARFLVTNINGQDSVSHYDGELLFSLKIQ